MLRLGRCSFDGTWRGRKKRFVQLEKLPLAAPKNCTETLGKNVLPGDRGLPNHGGPKASSGPTAHSTPGKSRSSLLSMSF